MHTRGYARAHTHTHTHTVIMLKQHSEFEQRCSGPEACICVSPVYLPKTQITHEIPTQQRGQVSTENRLSNEKPLQMGSSSGRKVVSQVVRQRGTITPGKGCPEWG